MRKKLHSILSLFSNFRSVIALLFVVFFYFNIHPAAAQDDDKETTESFEKESWKKAVKGLGYEEESKEFKENQWEKAVDGLDYSETPPRESSSPNITIPRGPSTFFAGGAAKIILIVLFGAVLVFVILKLVDKNLFTKNATSKEKEFEESEDTEDDPRKLSLEKMLKEALLKNNFKKALRVYYLMIIRELTEKKIINWKKEKTNGDYLLEASQYTKHSEFKELTFEYERVWYGDAGINELFFGYYSKKSEEFISDLRHSK